MISIVLPVYQVEDYIEDCLKSLLAQTYNDIEIICVNDCGMDNSVTIIKEYQKIDNRILLINHEENRGLGGARNTGIRAAKGDFILFIDSDDYTDETMVEKLYDSLISTKSDVAVCGVMLTFENDQQPHKAFQYDDLATKEYYDLEKDKEILTDMWPSAWNKLYKTSIIKKYHILFKEKILYEDHTFFYEYFGHCKNFSYVDEPLYFYRQQRPHSITTQSVGREKEIFKILDYISDIFADLYPQPIREKLFIKIAVRLLYERRWVFHNADKNYYQYLKNVANYLCKWDRVLLLDVKDTFIENHDPIFLSIEEIDKLEQESLKPHKTKPRLREKLKNFQNVCIRFKNDFYWYIPQIYQMLKDMENNYAEITNNSHKIQKQIYQFDKMLKRNRNFRFELEELKATLSKTNENDALLEKRLSNLELAANNSKTKIEEIWWLAWYLKDHQNADINTGADSKILRFYPTWIPCEYPEYFHGNSWHWSDKFKDYYIQHYNDCSSELKTLFANFSSKDVAYLKLLWERNIKIIPYSLYTEKEGVLLKTDFLFTKEELEEQDKIFRTYHEYISKYILPENSVYEIPVFYYEHGLRNLSDECLAFIKQGDILDLGAYIGDSALILSKYTDKVVYSIEMNESNYKKMEFVLKTNHVDEKVYPILSAVGDQDTTQVYYGDVSFSTLNKLDDTSLYKKESVVVVQKVDTLSTANNIIPHFIKIDVEGEEYKTIMGAKETIFKYKPILCISIYHTATDFLKIKPLIESWNLGYKFHIENHNPFDPVYEKMLICIPGNMQ